METSRAPNDADVIVLSARTGGGPPWIAPERMILGTDGVFRGDSGKTYVIDYFKGFVDAAEAPTPDRPVTVEIKAVL